MGDRARDDACFLQWLRVPSGVVAAVEECDISGRSLTGPDAREITSGVSERTRACQDGSRVGRGSAQNEPGNCQDGSRDGADPLVTSKSEPRASDRCRKRDERSHRGRRCHWPQAATTGKERAIVLSGEIAHRTDSQFAPGSGGTMMRRRPVARIRFVPVVRKRSVGSIGHKGHRRIGETHRRQASGSVGFTHPTGSPSTLPE
jgi:hypothetical protein